MRWKPSVLDSLREHFNAQRILLCFDGPISRSLIEEIGNALKNYLQAEQAHPSAAMTFGTYIEISQNPATTPPAAIMATW